MTPVYYSKKINPKKAYKNAHNVIQLAINKLNSNLKKNISFKKIMKFSVFLSLILEKVKENNLF